MLDEFKRAFSRTNNAHIQLIIINVVLWVAMELIFVPARISNSASFISAFAFIHEQFAIPANFALFLHKPWTLITYAFMHDITGILHILFNMLVLYWFGRLFVEYLGSDKLVALYVLGALAGAAVYLVAYNTVPFFIDRTQGSTVEMVGASASINAIVVAAATLLPNYTFYLLFFGPVKIKYIAAVTVFLSFIGTIGENGGGNVAHLGGALVGFVYIRQLQAGSNWGGWVTAILYWFKGLFKSRPRVHVSYRKDMQPAKRPPGPVRATQDEIDAILDKISEKGYESLSREEKEKLFNASKK